LTARSNTAVTSFSRDFSWAFLVPSSAAPMICLLRDSACLTLVSSAFETCSEASFLADSSVASAWTLPPSRSERTSASNSEETFSSVSVAALLRFSDS
jgi:hypothetical protein